MAKTQTRTTGPIAPVEDVPEAAKALSPARQLLKDALEAQGRAISLAAKAQHVLTAAAAEYEQALAEAGKYTSVDEDSLAARLSALKGEPGAKTPEEIREARRARVIANEELQAANLTLQAAQLEHEQAKGNISRSERVCASHATNILGEILTTVIPMWDTVNAEREKLRTILGAFIMAKGHLESIKPDQKAQLFKGVCTASGLPFGDYLDYQHLHEKADSALRRNFTQPDTGPGIGRARAYWASVANAVLADPAAEPAPLPSAEKLFG